MAQFHDEESPLLPKDGTSGNGNCDSVIMSIVVAELMKSRFAYFVTYYNLLSIICRVL